jgi:DNA-binding GntR family transcriptional regulator
LETRPFRPGQEISEVQIAQALGTSRTPVREALRQIEREGLIVHTARKGWTIHVLEPEELAQVFDLKEVVDGLIARRSAANMTPELATRVEAAVANMERAALAQDGQAWVAADDALHELLLEACHNPRAGQLTSSLNAYWRRLWIGVSVLPERMDYSTREHRAIINAILAGDAAQAEFLMREHVARLKLYLLSVLTNVVLPFSQP